MQKNGFITLGSSGIIGILATSSPAIAETPYRAVQVSPLQTNSSDLAPERIAPSMGQLTSVSQLSDVSPTDWSFQALQSLVERYGCISGYPNGTFNGSRSATRSEMAAALNACLDQISNRFASTEDLEKARALQDEFAAELATLRGRVDGLEARVATVEAQQFSTTTKLQGEVVIANQFGDTLESQTIAPFNGVGEPADSRVSSIARVRLNFNTSFSGKDLLQTQLEVGNNGSDFFSDYLGGSDPVSGGLAADTAPYYVDLGAADYAGVSDSVRLRRLAYSTKPLGDDLTVTTGPMIFPSDFVDHNSYANNSAQDFSSGFFINNPLIITNAVDDEGGAGGAIDWNVKGGPISLRAVVVSGEGNRATTVGSDLDDDGIDEGIIIGGQDVGDVDGGSMGDPFQASAELEVASTFGANDQNNVAARFQYTHAKTFNITQNVLGFNGEITFGRVGLFGRYGISLDPDFQGIDFIDTISVDADNHIQTWMAGVGFKDILIPGSLFSAAVGQPYIITGDGSPEQTNIEAFYRFPINDNISITPTVSVILNPLNSGDEFASDNTAIQGSIRTTFTF